MDFLITVLLEAISKVNVAKKEHLKHFQEF